MKDHYLKNPSELKGQPKKTIADYVESHGILVPKRFNSLQEARSSRLPIICRSEHPQEYNGVSGLLKSPDLDNFKNVKTERELKERILHNPYLTKDYCKWLDIPVSEFLKEVSYSYWEKLEGYNRTIVADDSIKGKYHIMTKYHKNIKWMINYTIFENNKISESFVDPLNPELMESLSSLVELYETVRKLDRFDPNHCPILEVQTLDNKHYFLQYHRSRDFEETKFSIDSEPEDEYRRMLFVRGATPENGITCNTTLTHAFWTHIMDKEISFKLPGVEEGSFDIHCGRVYSELMVKKRKLQMIRSDGDIEHELAKLALHHLERSKLFKPQVSAMYKSWEFFTEEEFSKMGDEAEETDQDQKITLHVISDGRKAYAKRLI